MPDTPKCARSHPELGWPCDKSTGHDGDHWAPSPWGPGKDAWWSRDESGGECAA